MIFSNSMAFLKGKGKEHYLLAAFTGATTLQGFYKSKLFTKTKL